MKKILSRKTRIKKIKNNIKELGVVYMAITPASGKEGLEDPLIAIEEVIEIVKEGKEIRVKRAKERQSYLDNLYKNQKINSKQ